MSIELNYKETIVGYYLCGIGQNGEIDKFRVGRATDRDSFTFPNGSYSPLELFLETKGSSATYVIIALPLSDIDDKGLFETITPQDK